MFSVVLADPVAPNWSVTVRATVCDPRPSAAICAAVSVGDTPDFEMKPPIVQA